MDTKGTPKLDSHTLFPTMMQATRLLILDYDVTRYHSFDLFRHLLRDRDMFMHCDPELLKMVQSPDVGKQILHYVRNNPNINPYDNFTLTKDQIKISEFESRLNNSMDEMLITPTDIGVRLGIVFNRPNITGYALRYKTDKYEPVNISLVKTYLSDHILDLRMALAIIEHHSINAVMLSSVDLALFLSQKLVSAGRTSPMSFMIADYFYNHDPETRLLRNVPYLYQYEQLYKFEYGVFDPYTGLNINRKGETNNE